MLMASSPASIIPRAASSVMSEPLLIMPTSRDALLLGVAHFLDELPIDERLAVVVHAHVRDAERGALVDDLREQRHVHDALLALHVVARAEHALRVADVGAFDLDDLGQRRRRSRPVASSSRRTGLALRAQQRAPRAWRARAVTSELQHACLLLPEVLDRRASRISSSSTVGRVADQRAGSSRVGHAPRHVLEPGLVGLVVRESCTIAERLPVSSRDPLGELADRDLLAVADVEDLADGARLVDQAPSARRRRRRRR